MISAIRTARCIRATVDDAAIARRARASSVARMVVLDRPMLTGARTRGNSVKFTGEDRARGR